MATAIYIRWSTEDQSQGHTLAIQRDSCRYYCLSQGWEVADAHIYIDDGCSGATLNRPALARLRQAVAHGEIHTVVVYKLDRLSRNVKDILNLALGEWDGRCAVRSTLEPVDTTTDAGRLFFTMLGSFADFERATIKTRTWSGRLKNAEQGKNPGHPYPYGYQRGEAGTFAIHPDEAAIVRDLFQAYVQGHSCHAIAMDLNRRAIPSRHGRGWSDAVIARLLRNPIYTGRLAYNGTVSVDGAAPALIDQATWEHVQRLRQTRPRVGRPGSPRTQSGAFLLTGLMRCPCGHALAGHYGSGDGRPYYYCVGAKGKGPAVCQAGMIQTAELDRAVVEQVQAAWPLQGVLRDQVLAALRDDQSRHEAETRLQQQRLATLERALERFRQDYKAGKIPAEIYTDLTSETRTELDHVRAQLERIAPVPERPSLRMAEALYARLNAWESLAPAERKHLLQTLVARVEVWRPRGSKSVALQVDWRLPAPD
jgi:site-specific DNA recombinase